VTLAWQVIVPLAPVAVPVYVVSAERALVVVEPLATGVSAPMPLSIENAVALVVVHERVD
jgi:hypothetical protein